MPPPLTPPSVPPPDLFAPRRRRRGQQRPPAPPSSTSEAKATRAVPHTRRHYPIPSLLSANNSPAGLPVVGSYPFPPTIPSLTPSRATITHVSQDEVVEETWGPITRTDDVPDKKHKSTSKDKGKKKKQDGEKSRKLKMCRTNGFQPRKGEEGEKGGKKAEKKLSGSTERITTYMVERMADGGKRKTWVTWSRIVTVVEQGKGGDGGKRASDSESEDSEEESGKEDKEESEAESESSDEEYFDEKRCEWRAKSELKHSEEK